MVMRALLLRRHSGVMNVAALLVLVSFSGGPAPTAQIDSISENDPKCPASEPLKTVPVFSPKLKRLWLEALRRPEVDLKRQAATAIARARQLGMTDVSDMLPVLTEALEAPEAKPIVQHAAAHALIVLDARETAPVLMKHALNDGFDMAQLIEPALGRWKYAPMFSVWLRRLEDQATPRSPLVLAIQAAETVPLEQAAPSLRRLALAPGDGKRASAPDIRLAAAHALGSIQPQGLESDARRHAVDGASRLDRLVAAALLQRHGGKQAEELLVHLAKDKEPAVATLALRRLVDIKPQRIQPFVDTLTKHGDGGVRRLAVQALLALSPQTPALVETTGNMLDDPDSDVRVAAQESLIKLSAAASLNQLVLTAAMKMLGTEKPRGQEQAILVLGTLRHKPAAARFLVLLDSKHSQVFVTAAWGLRRLEVPETAEAIFRRVKQETDKSRIPLPLTATIDYNTVSQKYLQLGHLIEALGVMRYRPAEPVLREYLPRPPPPAVPLTEIRLDTVWQPALRYAAVWSLGFIHQADPQRDLVELLTARMEDDLDSVQPIAAISLGRMKAQTVAPALRRRYVPGSSWGIAYACGWALHEITGEAIDPPKVRIKEMHRGNWFLEPLDP